LNNGLSWVSEWRIIPDDVDEEFGWGYKVSNGGVYTPTDNYEKALTILEQNIAQEKNRYLINQLTCPACNKLLSQHSGSISYERCLVKICMRKVAYV